MIALRKLLLPGVLFVVPLMVGCQNAIPTVTSLSPRTAIPSIDAKDSQNFSQLNAAAAKETLAGGYKAQVRISQPLAELHATSASGYKLKGTVSVIK